MFWVWCYSVNVELYKVLVKELARTLERQFSGNAESRAAGMVINTMGWIEGVGYEVTKFQAFMSTLIMLCFYWICMICCLMLPSGLCLIAVDSPCYRYIQCQCCFGFGSGKWLSVQGLLFCLLIRRKFSLQSFYQTSLLWSLFLLVKNFNKLVCPDIVWYI